MEEFPELDTHVHWQVDAKSVRSPDNKRKTNSLFHEIIGWPQRQKYAPLYTLAEKPLWEDYWGVWLPSAKQIFIYSENEYEAALKLVASIEHWNRLVANDWFVSGNGDYHWTSLVQWREEQSQRKIALVEGQLMKKAQEGNITAAKTLLGMHQDNRGRPSKEEVEGKKKKEANRGNEYENDANRILHLYKTDNSS